MVLEAITLYNCEMIIILYPIHWFESSSLIDFILASMFFFSLFHLNYSSEYVTECLTRNEYCRIFIWLFLFQFIYWFFSRLNLYVVSFFPNFCSWYVLAVFMGSDFYVWLWIFFCHIQFNDWSFCALIWM